MIKLRAIFGIFPVIVIYTNDLSFPGDAWNYGPVIIIKEKFLSDVGLLVHELKHAEFWYKRRGKECKTDSIWEHEELQCIAEQLKYYKKHNTKNYECIFKKLCHDICKFFRITTSVEEAELLIRKYVE